MNPLRYVGHQLGRFALWVDRCFNWGTGKSDKLWSDKGGNTNETISHTLGLEEAEKLYMLVAAFGEEEVFGYKDISIDGDHLLGELSSDLCDFFQKWHALRSITWDRDNAKELETKCPGIRDLVTRFLEAKGIKED